LPETKGLKQYIHTLTVDRKTGEPLSETFEPHPEEPEIIEQEFATKFLRAFVGDIRKYVDGMLNEFEMQERERTSQDGVHRAKGA
jgi:hypothetical protein